MVRATIRLYLASQCGPFGLLVIMFGAGIGAVIICELEAGVDFGQYMLDAGGAPFCSIGVCEDVVPLPFGLVCVTGVPGTGLLASVSPFTVLLTIGLPLASHLTMLELFGTGTVFGGVPAWPNAGAERMARSPAVTAAALRVEKIFMSLVLC